MVLDKNDLEILFLDDMPYNLKKYNNNRVDCTWVHFIIKCLEYDPIAVDDFLKLELNKDKVEQDSLINWSNSRTDQEILFYQELLDILNCPLKEVPLHINGMFEKIAQYRLKKGI